MNGEQPQAERVRSGLIPHRWTRVDDPEAVAVEQRAFEAPRWR